jgi:U4/U6 small nuclear ribonucleoprotein PRP31
MEARTTTLAEALLDDLDDLMGDSDEDEQQQQQQQPQEEKEEDKKATGKEETRIDNGFLDNNSSLQQHLTRLREHVAAGKASISPQASRNKEREEENHQLVVASNKHLANLAEEMGRAHAALAEAYHPKFPELEELLPNYWQYKKAVTIIGNEMDLTKVQDALEEILNSNQIITISVAGSTTNGRALTTDELDAVTRAADYMDQLSEIQQEMVRFVEQSMESLCPSICALIEPSTAAKLLGLAGGLQELTKIPSCNLQVMGQTKHTSESRAGLSGIALQQHVGILGDTQIIQSLPKQYQKKALKVVAAKLALAARFDFVNVDTGRPRSASTGLAFKQQILEKFDKWQEPDKAPTLKALPKPDLEVKKRRGGKRSRRWKERFEETAMMKQANMRAFSAQQGEYGDDAMGITMGLLDTADSGGSIRKVTERRKLRQVNTKASRKRVAQMAQHTKNKDGLASSVVFTQNTGMELVNPEANKARVKAANEKWFKDNAGFQSVRPKK